MNHKENVDDLCKAYANSLKIVLDLLSDKEIAKAQHRLQAILDGIEILREKHKAKSHE